MSKPLSPIRENISNLISEYLKSNNTSKAEFARKLNVSATSVTRWINKDCAPEIDMLPELADILGITLLDIFGIEPGSLLSTKQAEIIKTYAASISFKTLIDKYLSDEKFRSSIDYIINLN